MRMVFATDIHIGATPEGFQMQPRWIEGVPVLLERFVEEMERERPDLIVVGGDIVEHGIPAQIDRAVEFLGRLPGRVLVCLGNHDLTRDESLGTWRECLKGVGHVMLADAMVETEECDVIGLNTHWLDEAGKARLRWASGTYPRAGVTEGQMRQLRQWLGKRSDRPAILAMHAQLNGVPAAICGRENAFEPPTAGFEAAVREALAPYPRVRLTLGGHCHVAYAIRREERMEVTGTSLTEWPYQYWTVEVEKGRVRVGMGRIAGQDTQGERKWVYENDSLGMSEDE